VIHFSEYTVRLFPMLLYLRNLPAVGSAASLACGIVFASTVSVTASISYERLYPILLISAIVCSIVGILAGKCRVLFPAFCCAGYFLYSAQALQAHYQEQQLAALEKKIVTLAGTVITPPAPWNGQFKFLLRVTKSGEMGQSILLGKTFICTGRHYPADAHTLILEGIVHPGERRKNRYEFDEYAFFCANGIAGRIDVQQIVKKLPAATIPASASLHFRHWLNAVLQKYPNPDHRALIRASFTGEKEYISPKITAAFMHSGLIHLLALSGFNVAIVLAVVYFLLAVLPVSGTIKHVIVLIVLWMYFCFIGPIPSFTRAVMMATLVILSVMLQRKNYPLQTLGIAAIGWLIFSPSSLFQPGFQLSYAATIGILTLHPVLIRLYHGCENPIADLMGRFLFFSMSISVAAFCATLPILLYHFGSVSLYGIFANICAIPLMTGAMWSFFGALLVHPVFPLLSNLFVACSGVMTDWLLVVAHLSERIPLSFFVLPAPYAELIIIYYLFFVIIITIDSHKLPGVAALILPLLLCIIPGDYLLRRHFAPTEIVLFSSNLPPPIFAIRFPSGYSWIIFNGEERTAASLLQRTIIPWARHVPGTHINRICIFNRKHQCIDSTVLCGKRIVDLVAAVKLSDLNTRAHHYVCRYIPAENRLIVSMGNKDVATVIIDDHRCSLRSSNESKFAEQIPFPVKIILKGDEYTVHSFE
jgi:ComEC/Rec2-related protein